MPRNRCEGLPDRSCPENAYTTSVKLCQGDLMLCPQCEATRFGPAPVSKKIGRNPTTEPRPNVANGDVSTAHIIETRSASESVGLLAPDQCLWTNTDEQNETHLLKAEVNRLSDLVVNLSTKLSFVLSYLQLSDDLTSGPVLASVAAGVGPPATETALLNDNNTRLPYSTVVKANLKPTNFREAVVSAVYTDLKQKDSRKNSIIVSGLSTSPCNDNDKSIVVKLIKDEFDIDTDISTCQRLGQHINGKIQPLLVVLKNINHVKQILLDAKKLRKSADTLVRDQVYINPHLTKGEAMAAYEMRCLRRQRNRRLPLQDSINCSQPLSGSSNAEAGVVTVMVPAVPAEAGSFQQPSTDDNMGHTLAATATVFVPVSVRDGRPGEFSGQ